jgi:integrase
VAKRQAKVSLGKTHNMLDGKNLWKIEVGEPPRKEYSFRDRPYLFFVVRNEGKSRRWVFRYTFDGAVKKIDIGTYPTVTLASAREAWEKHNKCLALPVPMDPKVMLEREANEAKDRSVTVEHYLEKLKNKRRGKAHRTKASYGRHWENIRKTIGKRPAIEVARPELLAKFDIETRHYATPMECKQLCVQLYGLFEMVKKDFNLPNNIASYLTFNFQPVGDFHTVKHAPPMDYREYPAFIKACHDYKVRGGPGKGTRPDISLLTEMLFLTGVRPQEPREAIWNEIDLDTMTWNVPEAHRKTGMLKGIRPIPITPLIEKILLEMKARYPKAKKTDVIFPASRDRKEGKPFFSDDAIRRHIHNSMRWYKPLNPHSARNGFISWWGHSDFADRRELAEIQLDHALPGHRVDPKLIAAYQRDTFLEPRRKMMKAFDKHCTPAKPSSATITNISKHRISA